jgi:ATP-binding cassette subfamily B protein
LIKPVLLLEIIGTLFLISHSYLLILVPLYVRDIMNSLGDHVELVGIKERLASPEQLEPNSIIQLESQIQNLHELSQNQLIVMLLWVLGISVSAGMMMFLARWFIIGASRKIERQMRSDFLQKIQSLTPSFYHNNRTGDLITRFASDIESVRMLIGPGIMYPGTTCFTTGLALYKMYTINAELANYLLGPVIVLLLYVNYNTRFMHHFFKMAQEVYSSMSAVLQENFSGIRVIKAYTQEESEAKRFAQLNREHVDWKLKQVNMRGKLFPFMKFIASAGSLLILWIGGIKVINGTLDIGDLIAFTLYLGYLMWPIIALGWIINVIHRGMASWRRLHAVMVVEPEILDSPNALNFPDIRGGVEFRNLTFAYGENDSPILQNLSFKIKAGETLAVVGPTGSGKSTIVNVLLHLYPIPPGTVFIDGKDVNDLSLETVRDSIAYVSQDVFLFSDSVRSNILFGSNEMSEDVLEPAMMEAAAHAQLAAEIDSFPEGYETEVGERGITLSGGQKQRTGIARALILRRPILILDDCLSNVDANTEEEILSSLTKIMKNRTTIMISHRISTIKHADQIIVLDDGKIVEEGNHEQLVSHDGIYARMYNRQLLEESLGIRM